MSGQSPTRFPSQELDRFIVRLPDGMRDRIAEAAKANGRSMNAEIVARLERSFETNYVVTTNFDAVIEAAVSRSVRQTIEGLAAVDLEERNRILKFYGPVPSSE